MAKRLRPAARRRHRLGHAARTAFIEQLERRQLLSAAALSSLSGYVYEDANNDGVYQPALEYPIGGVTLILTGTDHLGNSVELSTATDYNGQYAFTNLAAGDYTLTQSQLFYYIDGKDTLGSQGGAVLGDDQFQIVLAAGTHGTGNNFGELIAASISGNVYHDRNNDGVYDFNEVGIANAQVTLTGVDDLGVPVELSTFTNPYGYYEFYPLRPGIYHLTESQPGGFLDGRDSLGTPGGVAENDRFADIAVMSGGYAADYNFGEIRPSSLSGYVYHDSNHDGSRAGESGIPDVTVTLTGTDDLGGVVSLSTVTNSVGFYSFVNLRPGVYTVAESQPAGYLDGHDTIGSPGGLVGNDAFLISLVQGTQGMNNNFGDVLPASLSGNVYVDANEDGLFGVDESGIAGVTVQLYDGGGNLVAATSTDGVGRYTFANLYPGVYQIVEVQPVNHIDGADHPGTLGGDGSTNDVFSNILITPGQDGVDYNFAETPAPVVTVDPLPPVTWQSKDGRDFVLLLGVTPTSLGNWLASTFPNLYGPGAGANNFSGKDQAYVADRLAALKKSSQKLDAKILGLAVSMFAGTTTLNSTPEGQAAAVQQGYTVTLPESSSNLMNVAVNLGTDGAAFGLPDHSTHTLMALLQALDGRTVNGVVFGGEAAKAASKLQKMVMNLFADL